MRSRSSGVILMILLVSPCLDARQRPSIREWVREHGDTTRYTISCGGASGLKEIVRLSAFTIEGVVSHTETGLDANESVYTDYVIDVRRILRMTASVTDRPSTIGPSPFVGTPGVATPGVTTARVRLRMINTGRIQLDGGVLTDVSGSPSLSLGQHIIASALLRPEVGVWEPFGLFEVREGRVAGLGGGKNMTFDSVEAFILALANPPPTTDR